MNENFQKIEINLNFKPSTTFVSGLTVNLVDFLLWNRTQIPFTVEVLEKFLERKNLEEIKCFKKLKAVKTAKEAYERICSVRELTKSQFSTLKSLIIIFGTSVQTAKEAYKINIPATNSKFFPPFLNESLTLRQIFLQLIQSDDLKDVLENPLPVTNTFILFQRNCRGENHENLFEIRNFKLNKSCKKFSINFIDSSHFEVLSEDFMELKIDEEEKVTKTDDEIWFQSKIYVRGFSDVIVDSKSIWT